MKKSTKKCYFGTTFVVRSRFDSKSQKIILWQGLIIPNEKIKSSNFHLSISVIFNMDGLQYCFLFQFLDRITKKMGKKLYFCFLLKKKLFNIYFLQNAPFMKAGWRKIQFIRQFFWNNQSHNVLVFSQKFIFLLLKIIKQNQLYDVILKTFDQKIVSKNYITQNCLMQRSRAKVHFSLRSKKTFKMIFFLKLASKLHIWRDFFFSIILVSTDQFKLQI